jgi:hypothetical protein
MKIDVGRLMESIFLIWGRAYGLFQGARRITVAGWHRVDQDKIAISWQRHQFDENICVVKGYLSYQYAM